MEEEAPNQKTKKIHHSLNPTPLNQSQENGKRSCKSKNKKNPLKPQPEGLKAKVITRKKKLEVKKYKKSIKA